MDFFKNLGGENTQGEGRQQNSSSQPNEQKNESFFAGVGDRLNSAAGGGRESEKNEDMLDKGIDLVQEKILGQGKQDNESAVEQAKDEQISDFIRGKYKSVTGSDMPIEDKKTRFG